MEFEPSSIIQEAKDAIRRYYHSDHDPFVCLDHARRNFQEATENPDPRSNLEALLGLSHTHGYLADIDPSKCTDHTQDAVATAERALSLCEEQLQDDKSLQARAHDTLGCALLQRYVYSAAMEDCDRAIAAHRKSLELTTSEDSPLVRSVRRSHLVRALYIQSRGLRHNRILHKRSLLEAVSMCQKYECNGANTPFTPITGNLLFLCARLLVDGKRSDKGKGKQSQTEGEGEPESIENQLQRTAQAMESNYDMIDRFCGPRHTRVAAELGTFGASLLTVTIPDSASDFAARGRSMLQSLMDESFQVDLRYATMLMDLLHTLVTDHESMIGVPTADLVKIIGRRLHRLLPQTHMERPELHYLLGKHLSSDDAQSGTSESRNKNVQLAIIQFRKAIALTPDQHPSRAPYLMSLISAQLGCLDTARPAAQTPEVQNILQEVSELADSLRVVEQSPNISPRYRKEIKDLLAEVGLVQNRMDARSASPVTASLSALSVADYGDLGSKGHSSEGYQATLVPAA